MSILGSGNLGMDSPDPTNPGQPPSSNQPAQLKRSRKAGLLWKTFGILVMICGFLGPSAFNLVMRKDYSFTVYIGILVFAFGVKFYLRGRRHLALSMQDSLAADPRPPVLYLRSFGADKSAGRIPTGGLLRHIGLSASLFDLKTEEELIAQAFNEIGPVVCIGKPGEKLPELGAARVYVSHEEWQQKVHDFMTKAKLVVMRLGDTPGFWWEVERSVKAIEPTRLLLLVPFGRRKYREFVGKAAQHFPRPLPDYSARGNFLGIRYTRSLGTLRGFVYFENDWTAHYVDLVRVRWPWKMTPRFIGRRRIIQKFKWGLQPVFGQLSVQWNPPRVRPILTTLATLAFIIFVGGPLVLAALFGRGAYLQLKAQIQSEQAEEESHAPRDINSIFGASDGKRLWAVGESGTILRSDDGEHWTGLRSGTQDYLSSIFGTSDGKRLWAVGFNNEDEGTIMQSDDAGEHWRIRHRGAKILLRSVFGTGDANRLWIVGDHGTILKSDDGEHWTVMNSGTQNDLNSIFGTSDGMHFWTVGSNGPILASDDGGEHWNAPEPGNSYELFSIFGTSDGKRLLAAGWDDTILGSDDGGMHWTSRNNESFASSGFRSIFTTTDGKRLWIVGDRGRILESKDGKNWIAHASGTQNTLRSIFGTSDGKSLWVVGDKGTILESNDSGKHWNPGAINH